MKKFGKKSFGLIEVLIACSILIILSGAVLAINVVVNNNLQFTRERAHAYYRAMEAIEAVRNIRDSNYIDGDASTDWDSFVCNQTQNRIDQPERNDPDARYIVNTNCTVGGTNDRLMLFPAGDRRGNYRSAFGIDYYNYLTFEDSGINPDIKNGDTNNNSIRVVATIEWESRGRTHSVELREILTNWKQGL